MHDLSEGVAGIELKLLQLCVQERYFSIKFLNDRMCRFDFEEKPALIDLRNPD